MIGKEVDQKIVREKLKVIRRVFGPIKKWKLIIRGWDSFVLVINDKWIFRFVRDKEHLSRIGKEIKFLKHFSSMSTLPVPKPEFIGEDFMGYKKIEGEEFSQKVLDHLDRKTKIKVAKQFIDFLYSLQKMPKKGLKQISWVNNKKYFEYYRGEIFSKIFPFLSDLVKQNIRKFFEEYAQNKNNFTREYFVLHADLNHRNILWDRKKQALSGIIDFSEISLGPEKRDLAIAEFFDSKNDEFLRILLKEYGRPELFREVKIESKIQMFEWLIDALEVKNKSEISSWTNKIKSVFSN